MPGMTPIAWTSGGPGPVPADLTGIRWPDGTIECRHRLLHPSGSLIGGDGEIGVVLTGIEVECTTCSDACAR